MASAVCYAYRYTRYDLRYSQRMDSLNEGGLFGSAIRTSTLIIISMLGETHAAEIASVLNRGRSRVKEAVDVLERQGVIIGATEGSMRRLRLNPRYVAADELRALLVKLGTADVDLQQRLASLRRRPRRSSKSDRPLS
jgi:biotin operon repressor